MRLEQLLYCIEVANCRTMSQASKKLFMTQPSLSTAIQNLEEELGFQIFKRSPHGVSLTDKGAMLLAKAEVIAAQVKEIKNLSMSDEEIIRQITIAAVPSACNAITLELIRELRNKRRRVNLNILELRPAEIMSSLVEGQADMVVGSYSEGSKNTVYNEAAKYNITVEPIFKDQMYAFLGRNHPKARQGQVTMAELQGEPQAIFNDWTLMEADEDSPSRVEMAGNYYAFSDKGSIQKVVANGLAYALLPSSMAYDDIYMDSGWIKALPIVDADVAMTIYIAYKNSELLSEDNKIIIDIIRQAYQKIADKMAANVKKSPCSSVNNHLLVY